MKSARLLLCLLAVLLGAPPTLAHEVRPAYLELTETAADSFAVLWKVPARGDYRLSLHARLPDGCADVGQRTVTDADAAFIARWTVACAGGLAGKTIAIDGLTATYTDVILRIAYLDGTTQSSRLTPAEPGVAVAAAPTGWQTAKAYFSLGVDHILLGIDHLLFVLALLILIRRLRPLVETITAFTVAHSITLAAAALGWADAPQPPVEAAVALSIAMVAAEVIRAERGRTDLSIRHPWVVAFLFGLLHGFGFGGALREIGLPQKDVPLALLSFNLGVEAGQLLFVAVALLLIASLRKLVIVEPRRARQVVAYNIGGISAFWFISRLAAF